MQILTNKKTLLHACCGPCSLEPSRILSADGHDITIFYANSNIDPQDEYTKRLTTLRDWAKAEDIPTVEGPYDHEAWRDAVGQASKEHPGVREERCRACYRLRFRQTAAYAKEHGYECISTTLSVSPYQYTDIIREELERAGRELGVEVDFRDFRPNYDEATRRSRELGMYRQNYCGCEFSDREALQEREERKAERQRQKEAYLAEHADEIVARNAACEEKRRLKAAYAAKQERKHALRKAYKSETK